MEVLADTLAAARLPPWYTGHVSMISLCDSGEKSEAVLSCQDSGSIVEGWNIHTHTHTHTLTWDTADAEDAMEKRTDTM